MSKRLLFFTFVSGLIVACAYAPFFQWIGLFFLNMLPYSISRSPNAKSAAFTGYCFGLGYFIGGLFWVANGIAVYIDDFWWAIPIAVIGLPAILALFTSLMSFTCWPYRESRSFLLIFCVLWVAAEWLISWVATGFPWMSLAYTMMFNLEIIQIASIVGTLGLSFIVIFISTHLYPFNREAGGFSGMAIAIMLIILIWFYGYDRLKQHPTKFTPIISRIVQPSIPQIAKWDSNLFLANLELYKQLSSKKTTLKPTLILWPEAALTLPWQHQYIYDYLQEVLQATQAYLLTGAISEPNAGEVYTSLLGLNPDQSVAFLYNKAHLVPFGEYVPFRTILPIKKLTHGLEDYRSGIYGQQVALKELGLLIQPMICYEAIFPQQLKADTNLLVNVTNDAWYGNIQPHQHFQITRMQALLHGVPLIRSANNGLSGIIDPLGRVVAITALNAVTILDGAIPEALPKKTFYSRYNYAGLIALIFAIVSIERGIARRKSIER